MLSNALRARSKVSPGPSASWYLNVPSCDPVTAGNASGVNDGAAALIVGDDQGAT